MNMTKTIIKNTVVLVSITLAAALILAVVYAVTKETIAAAEAKERMDSYYAVMDGAKEFKELTDGSVAEWNGKDEKEAAEILSAYRAYDENGGMIGIVVSALSHNGYGGDIVLSLGVGKDGVITAVKVTSMSETSGLGAECQNEKFSGQFKGKSAIPLVYTKKGAENDNEIDALTGATITTKAVLEAVNGGFRFAAAQLGKEAAN